MAFYLINKPKNLTSFDVVKKVQKKVNASKAGHSGTLDPFATGLMIVATEKDTKYLEYLLDRTKTYTGVMLFGKTTDTLDTEGKVIEEKNVKVNINDLKSIINEFFIGKIKQVPPEFSAIKVDGQKSYDLARKGIKIEHNPVNRHIYSFNIFETDKKNEFNFEVKVSSGTYIRALARDIGRKINSPAMLKELNRTMIGNLSIDNSSHIEEPKEIEFSNVIDFKVVEASKEVIKKILDGKEINFTNKENLIIFKNTESNIELICKQVDLDRFKIAKRIM